MSGRGGLRPLLAGPPRPLFIGVVHLGPGPGSPRFASDLDAVLARAQSDAAALAGGGADALLVENFGDAPFFAASVPPETVAFLARALDAVAAEVPSLPIGVNVLRNDARAALGLCAASAASFLRVNVHVGTMSTDQGRIEGRAAETLRERARLAPSTLILADVHVKHGQPPAGSSLADAAEETFRRGLADALILTGRRTGDPPARADLEIVRERVPEAPLLLGSGLSEGSAPALLPLVGGAIVGTALKEGGRIEGPVSRERVERFRRLLDEIQGP